MQIVICLILLGGILLLSILRRKHISCSGWFAIALLCSAIICHTARYLFVQIFRIHLVNNTEIFDILQYYTRTTRIFIAAELLLLLAALALLCFSTCKNKHDKDATSSC